MPEILKEQIIDLALEMIKCTHVQECSTKLLNFYVNDFLSLAQIRSQKFRKDCSIFNVQEAILEVISI